MGFLHPRGRRHKGSHFPAKHAISQSYTNKKRIRFCQITLALVNSTASWLQLPSSCCNFRNVKFCCVLTDEMREESVCHSGYFRAKCAWDELTVIAHARYGRMRINKCVSENFGYVGCSIDVIDVLDRYCSGRRSCYVRVFDIRPHCTVLLLLLLMMMMITTTMLRQSARRNVYRIDPVSRGSQLVPSSRISVCARYS